MKCLNHKRDYIMKKDNLFILKKTFSFCTFDFLLMILLGIINSAVNILSIYSFKKIIEILSYLSINFDVTIIKYIVLYIFSILIIFIYEKFFIRYWIQFVSVPRFEKKVLNEIHEKISKISNEKLYEADCSSKIIYTLKSATNLFRYTQIIVLIIISLLNVLFVTLYISSFNMIYIVFMLFSIVPSIFELLIQNIEIKQNNKEMIKIDYLQSEYFDSFTKVEAINEVKLFDYFKVIVRKHNNILLERNKIIKRKSSKKILYSILFSIPKLIGNSAGLLISTYLLFYGKINIDDFAVGISSYTTILLSIKSLIDLLVSQKQFLSLNKPYIDFINIQERSGKNNISFKNSIILKNVSFAYQKNTVLKNINLKIEKGDRIAIVGKNGSGKSTLINLILGFFVPCTGEVLYDGIDIKNIDEDNLHFNQSIVQQNGCRYSLTIEENIGFEKKVENVEDILLQIGLNYPRDKIIGLDFGNIDLSGGQWQRLIIERGFFKDSDLYVLDEPTSSIDPLNEKKLYNYFNKKTLNKTFLIVTHKLGSIGITDRIIVLDNGEIVEQGTHSELIKNKGKYYELWSSQKNFISD